MRKMVIVLTLSLLGLGSGCGPSYTDLCNQAKIAQEKTAEAERSAANDIARTENMLRLKIISKEEAQTRIDDQKEWVQDTYDKQVKIEKARDAKRPVK